jgi:hypothetical protein
MKFFKARTSYLLLLSLIIGCKSPKIITATSVVVHHDTLFSKEIHKDSTIHNIYSRDTVYIRDNKLTIKYLYKGDSSAYIGGTVARDTIVKVDSTIVIEKTKEVAKPLSGFDNFCRWFVILAMVGGLLYLGIKNIPSILKIIK